MLIEVETRLPPVIAELDFPLPPHLMAASERALVALGAMDGEASGQPTALARFMIRSESVASSKIERISASAADFARAIAGNRSNPSAVSMVAATKALSAMVDSAGQNGRIERTDIENAHAALMSDDPVEGAYAGRVRDDQNWIGGSDHSPRGALYVPPAPARVHGLLADLVAFTNRDDLPTMVQATIAHAQFESIHPFGDGNGRIGRALIGAILRRRGVTRNTVVPVASGLLARRDDYFDALGAYREGEVEPLLRLMCRAAAIAAEEGRVSVQRIKSLPREWAERTDARRGSTAAKLIPAFFDNPVMGVDDVERAAGATSQAVYTALARLEEEGIIHEITGRKRDRVWAASDLMDELDDLDRRIAAGMRA
ncbi:Fic family protein [Microbacterium immunditiarum]|uniref:Fic family protein n=1 Tax=Microbacterium immunditiarum TaxID=337480 RepID=A0A7Y9KLM9_9MICO|nr:Fic family protein [Microbacterium immunditiarum]NYE20438.1 Fic family protein [Microbacterium immunditiarum]